MWELYEFLLTERLGTQAGEMAEGMSGPPQGVHSLPSSCPVAHSDLQLQLCGI